MYTHCFTRLRFCFKAWLLTSVSFGICEDRDKAQLISQNSIPIQPCPVVAGVADNPCNFLLTAKTVGDNVLAGINDARSTEFFTTKRAETQFHPTPSPTRE